MSLINISRRFGRLSRLKRIYTKNEIVNILFPEIALGIGAVSPDLEKQGFLAVVFVNGEYSG
jgi:hypothetical protein